MARGQFCNYCKFTSNCEVFAMPFPAPHCLPCRSLNTWQGLARVQFIEQLEKCAIAHFLHIQGLAKRPIRPNSNRPIWSLSRCLSIQCLCNGSPCDAVRAEIGRAHV